MREIAKIIYRAYLKSNHQKMPETFQNAATELMKSLSEEQHKLFSNYEFEDCMNEEKNVIDVIEFILNLLDGASQEL